jgi:hypothetical protein
MEETIASSVEITRVHTYQVTSMTPMDIVFTVSKGIRNGKKNGCLELHYGDGVLRAVKWREREK